MRLSIDYHEKGVKIQKRQEVMERKKSLVAKLKVLVEGKVGADGHVLIAFDVPPPFSDPFCGSAGEGSTLRLACGEAGATIASLPFASYGTPTGACPSPRRDAGCDAAAAPAAGQRDLRGRVGAPQGRRS